MKKYGCLKAQRDLLNGSRVRVVCNSLRLARGVVIGGAKLIIIILLPFREVVNRGD
jgi:hypothetical protein